MLSFKNNAPFRFCRATTASLKTKFDWRRILNANR